MTAFRKALHDLVNDRLETFNLMEFRGSSWFERHIVFFTNLSKVKKNNHLQKLIIHNISDVAHPYKPHHLKKIIRAVEKMPDLKELNLYGNLFGESDGPLLLADLISTNTSIQKLDLSHNCFKPSGLQIILATLENNKTLRELDISQNRLDEQTIDTILDVLDRHPSVNKINISNSYKSEDAANLVFAAVKKHPNLQLSNYDGPIITQDKLPGPRHYISSIFITKKIAHTHQFFAEKNASVRKVYGNDITPTLRPGTSS